MKKRNLFTIGILAALLLTGCSGSDNAETESLKQQIAQLEQQVEALQAASEGDTAENSTPASADEVTADTSLSEQPASDESTQTQPEPAQDTAATGTLTTTNTIEELTTLVTGYVEKVKAASPNGTASENMEQFFTLKQEEHQIDDALDLHEDELEYMYRKNALTRDEYKKLERELEQLEDQLDDAEDWLEYTFGIDD